jgi:uncharacterized protein with NRDE domain
MLASMCLLVVMSRMRADLPLVVAANRDEFLARPTTAMTVLVDAPRIRGGRDLVAGGTWLAIHESGMVAGLTNVPGARDPSLRSRGELPLFLVGDGWGLAPRPRTAVARFAATHRPRDYSPCWLLVGDATSLFHVDMSAGDAPAVRELPPGLWILENRPLEPASVKARAVARALDPTRAATLPPDALLAALQQLLGSRAAPPPEDDPRPPELLAPCVHAGPYGTRSASITFVGPDGPPRLWSADGPPDSAAFTEIAF